MAPALHDAQHVPQAAVHARLACLVPDQRLSSLSESWASYCCTKAEWGDHCCKTQSSRPHGINPSSGGLPSKRRPSLSQAASLEPSPLHATKTQDNASHNKPSQRHVKQRNLASMGCVNMQPGNHQRIQHYLTQPKPIQLPLIPCTHWAPSSLNLLTHACTLPIVISHPPANDRCTDNQSHNPTIPSPSRMSTAYDQPHSNSNAKTTPNTKTMH
jgi:hypothetical protein